MPALPISQLPKAKCSLTVASCQDPDDIIAATWEEQYTLLVPHTLSHTPHKSYHSCHTVARESSRYQGSICYR